ncbi:9251_t:CDS:2 [Diversispora eburnea]|uniref:9251_t:CDS:1 n=1 Tax=Diversispora eburnea TaxID=1213867 RepID=A0A9N9CSA0_9GLOM|nr:9251_t:CDS:2 [Diversispora eburnea]
MSNKENEVLINENKTSKENEIPVSDDETYFRNILGHGFEDYNNGTSRKRVLKCDLGGRYNEKLSRPALGKKKNKGSKKRECMWQINITRKLNSPIVTVTSFNNEHNHNIYSETIKFSPIYNCFSQEIMVSDLTNAIQKIKREKGLNLGDAVSLLTKLLEYQKKDSECVFEKSSEAGTQSTQRAESENALIQKAVQSSFSLSQVQEVLENRHETEFINNSYSIWKTATLQYIQPFVMQTFFSDIDNLLKKKYLTQPIHDAHYKQMCQSVCYRAFQIPIAKITTSGNDSFEPFYDNSSEILIEADEDRELNLQSLIAIVSPNEI